MEGGKMMTGELLEAYCALAKAYCYLDYIKNERNEKKINELIDKIKYVEHEIYELSKKGAI